MEVKNSITDFKQLGLMAFVIVTVIFMLSELLDWKFKPLVYDINVGA